MRPRPRPPLLLLLALLSACSTLTLRVPRSELQADLAARFPVDVDKHVVVVRLSDPVLDMPGAPDRIGLRLRFEARTTHARVGGSVRVEGRIGYVASERAFYLREPTVSELAVDPRDPADPTTPPGRRLASLRAGLGSRLFEDAARLAIEETLRVRPIYRLDATRSAREAKAIRHLRSVRIDDQDLVLEVAL